MSESNVLSQIIEGVLEDVEKRFVPINQLREQLEKKDHLLAKAILLKSLIRKN